MSPKSWGCLGPGNSVEMTVWDRTENFKAYDFSEIIHFDVAGQ